MASPKRRPAATLDEERNTDDLKLHAQANVVPDPNQDDWDMLAADIQRRGIQVPIEILSDGTIVDGRTRYRIAKNFGIQVVPVRIVDPPDPFDYMILAAVARRHLSKAQATALFQKSPTWTALQAKHSAREAEGTAAAAAGEGIGTSEALVEKVGRLQQEPALHDAVSKAELSEKEATLVFRDETARAAVASGGMTAKQAYDSLKSRQAKDQAAARAHAEKVRDREERLRSLHTHAPDLWKQVEEKLLKLDDAEDMLDDREAAVLQAEEERLGIKPEGNDFQRKLVMRPSHQVNTVLAELKGAPAGAVELQLLDIVAAIIDSMRKTVPFGTTGFRRSRRDTVTMAVDRLTKFRDSLPDKSA